MELLIWPHPKLKLVSKAVDAESLPEVLEAIPKMAEIMVKKSGIGISAIQVGIPLRCFLMRTKDSYVVVINPKIVTKHHPANCLEGCLSLPGQYGTVRRAESVAVSYQNEKLEPVSDKLYGIDAQVFQHELEHLNGELFVNNLTSAERSTIRSNIHKMRLQGLI